MPTRIATLIAASAVLLALAVAPAALAGGGCQGSGTPASVGTATVLKIDGCTFMPSINRVAVGTRVTWINTSNAQHDVTGTAWAWKSPLLDVGDSFSQTFTQAGLYPYSCSLHPGMAGIIEVETAKAATAGVAGAAVTAAETLDGAPGPVTRDEGSTDLAAPAAGALGLIVGVVVTLLIARRRSPAA